MVKNPPDVSLAGGWMFPRRTAGVRVERTASVGMRRPVIGMRQVVGLPVAGRRVNKGKRVSFFPVPRGSRAREEAANVVEGLMAARDGRMLSAGRRKVADRLIREMPRISQGTYGEGGKRTAANMRQLRELAAKGTRLLKDTGFWPAGTARRKGR